MDWQHGYFAEQGYVYGVHREAAPDRMAFVASLTGCRSPSLRHFRYLDAGCGQGLHLVMLAALYPEAEFVGIDFMPEHIAHGRDLAAQAGLRNVLFLEADFLSVADTAGPGLDDEHFDYAVAHGICAWVSPAVRSAMLRLVSRVLKPGGLFYNAYNTHPGWLSTLPMQHLVRQYQPMFGLDGAMVRSVALLRDLEACGSALFEQMSGLTMRLKGMDGVDAAYLGQEYGNRYWEPMFVADMLALCAEHKLGFLGSCTLSTLFDTCLPEAARTLLEAQPTSALRETVRDLALCQGFRRDLMVKGRRPAWPLESERELMRWRFRRVHEQPLPAAGEPFEVAGGMVSIKGHHAVYLEHVLAFDSDSGATLAEVRASLRQPPSSVVQIAALLWQGGWISPWWPQDEPAGVLRLNQVLTAAARLGAPYGRVALARARGTVHLPLPDMLILGDLLAGIPPEALPERLLRQLQALGQLLEEKPNTSASKGTPLERAAERVWRFLEQVWPVLLDSGVGPGTEPAPPERPQLSE